MQGVVLGLPFNDNEIVLPMKGRGVDVYFEGLLCHKETVTSKEKEKQMQKIDSKRILEPEAAKGLLCPYLTEAHAERYCHGPGCMAWRWRNEETQYRVVKLHDDAPDVPHWLSKDEAEHYKQTGHYGIEEREPAGWCGYSE